MRCHRRTYAFFLSVYTHTLSEFLVTPQKQGYLRNFTDIFRHQMSDDKSGDSHLHNLFVGIVRQP